MRPLNLRLLLVIGLTLVATGREATAQSFELLNESGRQLAEVRALNEGMLVDWRGGGRQLYRRTHQYDSRDGRYHGYYHHGTHRALRFPVIGGGAVFVANFRQPFPSFHRSGWFLHQPGTLPFPARPGIYDPWLPPAPLYGYQLPPLFGPVLPAYRAPLWTAPPLVESRTIPGPQLPPVNVELFNDSRRALQVSLIDHQQSGQDQSFQIPAGQSVDVRLQRDSSDTLVERYHVPDGFGGYEIREISTPLPPQPRYEVVVHQWQMQSIAIDRTGKSPNVIEDVNFQGRGIGRFWLPPGDQLQSGRIEVYSAARQQQNPGTVGPIVPQDEGVDEPLSPLERALLDVQRNQSQ